MINKSTWWAAGDDSLPGDISSEIFIADQGWQNHISTPPIYEGGCNLQLNESHYFLTGGWTSTRAYIIDITNGDYQAIAPTSQERVLAGCGVVTLEDGRKEVVITGGGYRIFSETTEIFSLDAMEWRWGPDFPVRNYGMASVQAGSTFYVLGGCNNYYCDIAYHHVYKYNPVNETWDQMPQTLTFGSATFPGTAIFVSDDFVTCE